MSRSNPHENGSPNPATRWFEWNGDGEKGGLVRYYDKENKKVVDVGSDFTFLLLDELAGVRGWDDASDCGITSNEVKDSRKDVMVVRSVKGGPIAEGLYRDIKDRVNNAGGSFVVNCYIAYKNGGGELSIGSLRFKGSALHEWSEFRKKHRAELYKKAIAITGYTEGKKGRVVYRVPNLELRNTAPETDKQATALDAELQAFLKGYFSRKTADQVAPEAAAAAAPVGEVEGQTYDSDPPADAAPASRFGDRLLEQLADDDIPF